MRDTAVTYRFEAYLYPAHVSRIDVEHGVANWRYIRRRSLQLADERNEQIMLYVYNDFYHRWDYIGKALPGGEWYTASGSGPYVLDESGDNFLKKKGGEA